MRVSNKSQLLDRLRKGPLVAADWRAYASSRKSLHVRICKLRAEGYEIETVIFEEGKPGLPGEYHLISEPRCPFCKREFKK